MSQLPIIEICISLVLVFFVLSVMVSSIGEVFNTIMQRRSTLLKEAIQKAFNQAGNIQWGSLLYGNALVDNLKRKKGKLPSYISANTFSSALVSEIIKDYQKKTPPKKTALNPGSAFVELLDAVSQMQDGKVKDLLISFIKESTDLESFNAKLCKWYDEYMERVTGWFSRKTKIVIAIIAGILCVALNIDTIRIAKELWTNEALRTSLVVQAEKTVASNELAGQLKEYSDLFRQDSTIQAGSALDELNTKIDSVIAQNNKLAAMNLPIGWKDYKLVNNPYPEPWLSFLQMLLGWVITAFALTAGAPFWFRVMGKLVNLRNSGVLPTEEPKKKT
jgi:hypothetical protein